MSVRYCAKVFFNNGKFYFSSFYSTPDEAVAEVTKDISRPCFSFGCNGILSYEEFNNGIKRINILQQTIQEFQMSEIENMKKEGRI